MRKKEISIYINDRRELGFFGIAKRLFNISAVAAIFFGPGILLGSVPMQWAGFCALCLLTIALPICFKQYNTFMSFDEARKKLDELEKQPRS